MAKETKKHTSSFQPIKKFSVANLGATVLGLGYIKIMPGTIGSLVGLIDFSIFIYFLNQLNFIYIPIVMMFSSYVIDKYCNITKKHDPKEVIIDEYAGQYLCCFLTYFILGIIATDTVKISSYYFPNYYVLASCFIFFRFFDISKIGPVGYFDRKTDNLSILTDDLVAGILAAIVTILIFLII